MLALRFWRGLDLGHFSSSPQPLAAHPPCGTCKPPVLVVQPYPSLLVEESLLSMNVKSVARTLHRCFDSCPFRVKSGFGFILSSSTFRLHTTLCFVCMCLLYGLFTSSGLGRLGLRAGTILRPDSGLAHGTICRDYESGVARDEPFLWARMAGQSEPRQCVALRQSRRRECDVGLNRYDLR